eukprot:TRINITY_DN18350_c0_g1_i1.p2 TRINITY_DN18350_c0_g1~~TRINITY_DN18350_c0_g1_i1.p2  ORF type:complete len:184 (-),score=55.59 TRINITY_DN18350_c0_g1_i1:547-1098(-)
MVVAVAWWYPVSVVAISVFGALLSEGIAWLLVFRTSSYHALKENVERLTEKKKNTESSGALSPTNAKKSVRRKIDTLEEDLKSANRDMTLCRMKATFVVGFILILLVATLNSLFEGRAVAKIPFNPWGLVQNLSHRGLPGRDTTDCSAIFLYMLCSMALRTSVQKLFGTEPPPGANSLFTPPK